jgi:signal transduction histidine kinase
MNHSNDDQKVAIATRTLALLNQQADAVRAELTVLRADLARVHLELSGVPSAQLLEANEQLVLAALRAQSIADSARHRLGELTRAGLGAAFPALSASGEMARVEYQTRVADLREANEQLLVTALSSQESEADAELAHTKQIKFLAMAAHELRNPLLPLRLAAQMLTRAQSDAQLLLKLQATINGQVSHMARLIGDLLDGSRISTGKFRIERSKVDLSGILELAIQTGQPAMDVRRHRFRRIGASGPMNVLADPVRLVQVFSNLLENAAKYTHEDGEITMKALVLSESVEISITDNGIGITPQALPHIFDLFVQDDHAAAHNQGGLGIGLAVVRELVEAHGGTVVASSAGRDQGSKFTVTLPLAASLDFVGHLPAQP